MAKGTVAMAVTRGRLDHLLPKGYLEGFLNPSSGRFSVYDRERKRWFETGPAKVAAIRGCYDYAPGSVPDQTADEAFWELETRFPILRRQLVDSKFSGWRNHLEFLLAYAQMLRTRTELFRQQMLAEVRTQHMFRVAEVFPDPVTGNTTIRYEELTETDEEREVLHRNLTITTMRSEIAKGAAGFLNALVPPAVSRYLQIRDHE